LKELKCSNLGCSAPDKNWFESSDLNEKQFSMFCENKTATDCDNNRDCKIINNYDTDIANNIYYYYTGTANNHIFINTELAKFLGLSII